MKGLFGIVVGVALGVFACGSANALEWCTAASKPDELAVCGNPTLTELDSLLMGQYQAALAKAQGSSKKAIKTAQRKWLSNRAACGTDADCIERQYRSQIVFFGGETPASRDGAQTAEVAQNPSSDSYDTFGTITVHYHKATGSRGVEALIVANDQYQSLQDLQTPSNDAELVSSALAFRGIKAETLKNAAGETLERALEGFRSKPDKNIFVFYYAGHAADINGTSSLLFSEFDLARPTPGRGYGGLPTVVEKISKLGYKKILIVFDACRDLIDIPAERNETLTAAAAAADGKTLRNLNSREVGIGRLQGIDYAISFSASKGQSAVDSLDGVNSPFAKAFAFKLRERETFFDVMIETRREVRRATSQQQHPTLELSWDEDTALNADPIQSVTLTLPWDHKGKATAHIEDVKPRIEHGTQLIDIEHSVDDRSCGLYSNNATGVGFSVYSLMECVEQRYVVVTQDKNKTFTYLPTTQRDGILLNYEGLNLVVDLDGDGETETVGLGSNRYGGYVEFAAAGHRAYFYSELGPNASSIFVDDIDGNGIRDLVVEYQGRAPQEAPYSGPQNIVVISGERLMSGLDGEFYTDPAEEKFAGYIPKTEWMGRVGGLYPVIAFFDHNLKHVRGIVGSTIQYTTYQTTWENSEENIMPDKEATFLKDGSINLTSYSGKYRISSFHDPEFKVVRE